MMSLRHITSLSPSRIRSAWVPGASSSEATLEERVEHRHREATESHAGAQRSGTGAPSFAALAGEFARGGLPESSGARVSFEDDPTTWRAWRAAYVLALLVADALAAQAAVWFAFLARPAVVHGELDLMGWQISYKLLALVALCVWLLALALGGGYRARYPAGDWSEYRLRVVTALRLMAVVVVASFASRAFVSRGIVLVFFPSLAITSLVSHWVLRRVLGRLRRGGLARNRMVLVGDEAAVEQLVNHFLRDVRHGYQIVGVCLPGASSGRRRELRTRRGTFPIVGDPDGLVEVAQQMTIDSAAVVGSHCFESTTLQQVAWQLERRDVDLLVAPDVVDVAGPRVRFAPVSGMPLLQITEPRIYGPGCWLKPCYERLLAIPILLLAAPLLLLVSLAILIDSGRPIFYRQRRVGFGGDEFEMIKFRTMVPDADAMLANLLAQNEHDGALFKIRDDPRVTRIGRILRKYSLDELAQLVNVVKGEMLLVGPRPCLPRETEEFGEAARRRFLARPGMTGLWQVSGRSDIPWEEAVRLDLYYVENWSLLMDLMIVWRTLRVVGGGQSGY